ncbi:protein kinase family protein [Candidatus Micrarchaeota archaeon]|nr:protein kinase family protein [Candidatus Micrarchaeota archaeon]
MKLPNHFIVASTENELVYHHSYEGLFKGHWRIPLKPLNFVGKSSNPVLRTKTQETQYDISSTTRRPLNLVLKFASKRKIKKEFENHLRLVEKIPTIHTLTPIGYSIHNEGGVLYTVLEKNAFPLRSFNFEQLSLEQRRKFLEQAAKTIALLHASGITHNDLKLKNTLYNVNDYRFYVTDLARMNFSNGTRTNQAANYDLLTFIGDSLHKKLANNKQEIEEYFLKPYLEQLRIHYPEERKTQTPTQLLMELINKTKQHPRDKVIQLVNRLND